MADLLSSSSLERTGNSEKGSLDQLLVVLVTAFYIRNTEYGVVVDLD